MEIYCWLAFKECGIAIQKFNFLLLFLGLFRIIKFGGKYIAM